MIAAGMVASIARGLRTQGLEFGVGEDASGLFCGVEDAIDERVAGGDAVALEPKQHIGFATHGTDFNDLVETEEAAGDAAVDDVSQAGIFAVEGFDDGGGVNSRGGAEGVTSDHRIVWWDGGVRGSGDFFAIFLEAREVAIDQAQQAEIDEHEFHGCVADTLAEGIGGGVNAVGAGGNGRQGVGDGQAAIVVAVPVDANFLAGGLHDFGDGELNEIEGALRHGVSDGVAENDGAGAATNGGGVEAFYRVGIGADGVFGDVH